jgi:hypothetical protein
VNCLDRLAGKPKTKKNGNKGGKRGKRGSGDSRNKSNRKNKKDLSEIECCNCHEKGHYKNKCPKLKDAKAANVKVALNIQVVNSADHGVHNSNACNANACNGKSPHGQVCKRMAKVAKKTWINNPKCDQMIDPWFLYCLECSDAEESVNSEGVESVSSNIESVHDCQSKIDSSKWASPIPKRFMHELSDDFFDAFGSDSAEEDDSEANLDPKCTLLWWADACEEFSLDSMEQECEKFSSTIMDAVLHAKGAMKSANNHGNGVRAGQLDNGEDEDGDKSTMAIPCLTTGTVWCDRNDVLIPVSCGDTAENASAFWKRKIEDPIESGPSNC